METNQPLEAEMDTHSPLAAEAAADEATGPASDSGAGTTEAAPEPTAAEASTAQGTADDWQQQYVRLLAEFDNYKKRTAREKQDISDYAKESVLRHILPVVDDLQRALKAAKASDNVEKMREGLDMMIRKVHNGLGKLDVTEVPGVGEPFDSDFHDALMARPAETETNRNRVLEVLEAGYRLGNRVIKPAKVVVGE